VSYGKELHLLCILVGEESAALYWLLGKSAVATLSTLWPRGRIWAAKRRAGFVLLAEASLSPTLDLMALASASTRRDCLVCLVGALDESGCPLCGPDILRCREWNVGMESVVERENIVREDVGPAQES
jgi:hypothetical protein